jgi:hypothetical protein
MDRQQLWEVICALAALGLFQAKAIWRLVRERNYSRELLVREQRWHTQKQTELQRQSIARQNDIIRLLATAYASAQPATLDELLQNTEQDWSLRSSKTPSDPPEG